MRVVDYLRKTTLSMLSVGVITINGNVAGPTIAETYRYLMSRTPMEVAQNGRWDTLKQASPVRSIHAVMLPTGKVLLVAGSGNDKKSFAAKSFKSVIWNPADSSFKSIETPADMFCSGHAFLPDGRVLIAGGTKAYENLQASPRKDYQGLKDAFIFDPWKETYERVPKMNEGRWYPTLVGLANGDILAASGLDEKGHILRGKTEIFDHINNTWVNRPDLNQGFATYPALFLTDDGRLLYSGSNSGYGETTFGRTPGIWNITNGSYQVVPGLHDAHMTETSSSVLLPPAQDQRVMILGGGGTGDSNQATKRTAIVDLKEIKPHYVDSAPLHDAVRYPSVVILPNDTLLETGGSAGYRKNDILNAQIYHPQTDTWEHVADPWVGRDYHSEALLLPDGRVATFGSDPLGKQFEMRIEVYSPAYIFKQHRPEITNVPTSIGRGDVFVFGMKNSGQIGSAKLIRPSAVTHVTDVEQRSVNLEYTAHTEAGQTHYHASVPENSALLPAGWYMFFVTDVAGTPSVARWIQVK